MQLDDAAAFCNQCGTQMQGSAPIEPDLSAQPAVDPSQPWQPAQEPDYSQPMQVPDYSQPAPSPDFSQQAPVEQPVPSPDFSQSAPFEQPQTQTQQFASQQQPEPQMQTQQFGVPPQQAQQPYAPAQPYPGAPVATPPKKKKSKLPLIIGLAVGILVIIGVTVAIAISCAMGALGETQRADFYTISNDQVPSVKAALGEERTLTGYNISISGSVETHKITYSSPDTDQAADMSRYVEHLRANGYLTLTEINFNTDSASGTLGRNSVDEGFEIQVLIEYDTRGYVITLLRQPGGITPNEQGPNQPADPDEPIDNPEPENPDPDPSPDPAPDPGPSPDPSPGPNVPDDAKAAFVGVWKLDSMVDDGVETSGAALEEVGYTMTMTLSDDGKLVLDSSGEKFEGTWEPIDATTASLIIDNDPAQVKIVDGMLILEEGKTKLTFKKQ